MAQLRGLEGDAARQYFSTFNDMIVQQKADFVFSGRSKRPPLDKVNALLSFGYSLLDARCRSRPIERGVGPLCGIYAYRSPGADFSRFGHYGGTCAGNGGSIRDYAY